MSELATRLWWIRHAPVNHGGRIYGQLDLSCDSSEAASFTGLAEQLPRGAVWVTSNLRRAHETADAIVRAGLPGPQRIPGPDAVVIDDLAEQRLANGKASHMRSCTDPVAAMFIAFGTPLLTRRLRVAKAFLTSPIGYHEQSTNWSRCIKGRDVIVVAHGGMIRAVLALALRLEPEAALAFTIENCSVTRIDHIEGPGMGHRWCVVTANRPPH